MLYVQHAQSDPDGQPTRSDPVSEQANPVGSAF